MRCSVLATSILTVLLVAAALPHAAAHPAGPLDGYTRYAHDCSDDYGPHGGINTETAHDGIAIDVIEKDAGQGDLLYIRISMSKKASSTQDETRETVTFDSPGLDSAVKTTVDSTDEETFDLVSSQTTLNPKHVRGPLEVRNTDGSVDTGRVGFELGYSYSDLKVANGQNITNIELVTLHKGALTSSFTKADHVPGGTYTESDDPASGCDTSEEEEHLFIAAGYTVQKSDHTAPGGSDDDSADQGGSNADPGSPVADFTFSPERPKAGQTITFTDASGDPDGTVVAWSWDFGDGNASTERNPTHTYGTPGTYVVTLTVTDDADNTDTTSQDLRFQNQPPTATFRLSAAEADTGQTVTFTDQSSDPDGTITEWTWEFGDGSTGEGQTVTHAFDEAGTYSVTLTVRDDAGARASTTETITVHAAADDADDTEAAPGPALVVLLVGLLVVAGRLRRWD